MKKISLLFLLAYFAHSSSYSQETQIKGFANVDAIAVSDNQTTPNQVINNYFGLGQYDLFITSQLSEKIKMLGESVFEFDGSSFVIDLERVIVDYNIKEHFNVSMGKFHLPIGYWNNAYHHGMALQPTAVRPDALKFEDEGGILPIHDIGVQFHGDGITKYNIGYNLMIGNGVAANAALDLNRSKSITANLHLEPVENIKLIVSGFKDVVPDGFVTAQGVTVRKTDIQIFNVSLAYMEGVSPIEFIAEYYNVNTRMNSVGSKGANGYILYAGYKIKKWVPYASFDGVGFEKGEQYFIMNNLQTTTLGLRYSMNPISVVKLEYQYKSSKPLIGITGLQNKMVLQLAFGF